ncbi:MAG: AEC family transporter [Synergistaceae bacterium]|nr:AEC family transporter [Synergistaceae bacterium]
MNLDFFTVASNLVSLFSLIAVGYIAVRLKILDEHASHAFSSLLMKITLPCTIFVSLVQRDYDPSFLRDGITIIIAGIIVFAGLMYLSRYVAILFRVPENCRGVWAFTAAYTNSGFMGFPIALVLFGGEGLALSVLLNIAFNMTIYTIGPLEIARDNPGHEGEKINIKSIIFSNINFATLVSLIFYFGQIKVPAAIISPLNYISGITTPLSMIMIGIALAHSKASELFTDIHAWTNTIIALLVYPAAIALILKFFPLSTNPLVDAVLILIVAMPAASVTAVMCEMYHGNIDFAAKVMFLQNLFCVVTIPLICLMI